MNFNEAGSGSDAAFSKTTYYHALSFTNANYWLGGLSFVMIKMGRIYYTNKTISSFYATYDTAAAETHSGYYLAIGY